MSLLQGLYTVPHSYQVKKTCFIQWSYGIYVQLDTATMGRGTMGRNRVTIPRRVKAE